MALTPIDEAHALQIKAGTLGRKSGHQFEDNIVAKLDKFTYPVEISVLQGHIFQGDPAWILLCYICNKFSISRVHTVRALSTGSLATSEIGKHWLVVNGIAVSRCKSDIILTITADNKFQITVGVSIKQCNKSRPTNAQLFFTTAQGFTNLLINNGIPVSKSGLVALKQFCGDPGFRPLDILKNINSRSIDPRRFFWEEIDPIGKFEWENIFSQHQTSISKLLFQKAYLDDPFIPEFLLHKTKSSPSWDTTEVALYTIDEILYLSECYRGFHKKMYTVRKGKFKDPVGTNPHEAPRFGIIQMQRGGQTQHPEQLQFNLEAGYFYKL